jgi:CBS domain-containing protein
MKITQLMTPNVKSCRPEDSLNTAAQIMWDNDCGCVPVVTESGQVVGILTDRDICMAAYTQGALLQTLRVESAMAHKVIASRPEDSISTAETLMRENRVRRLPVVNTRGDLVGIISLNDIALEAEREHRAGGAAQITESEIGETLGNICHHRNGEIQLAA